MRSALAAGVFIVAVWVGWAFFSVQIAHLFVGTIFIPAQAGPWGDSFGAFNALFGALGFAAVVGTLLLQMRAIERQERDQHRQHFESSFFQMVELLREVRSEVQFKCSEEVANAGLGLPSTGQKGRLALSAAAGEVRYWLSQAEKPGRELSRTEMGNIYRRRVHRRYENSLSPYFRLIYTVLDRVRSDTALPEDDKIMFANILRSQLNTRELELIALNALTKEAKDMHSLVEMFRMLKYLPSGPMRRRLRRVYPKETFEGRDASD